MSNQLALQGAQSAKPVRFATLWQNRAATGLWTQRSPLRDAASTRLEEKFYGARNDALIDGTNIEVSNSLTFIRRPGSSVYNSQTFPHINSFYEFRIFNYLSETIKVMADTASYLYDATGPSTKSIIWTKSAGAGQTLLQSVGNTLYFGNGVDQKKWVQSAVTWSANATIAPGTLISEGAEPGTLYMALGGITLPIIASQCVLVHHTPVSYYVFTLWVNPAYIPDQFANLNGVLVTFSGFTGTGSSQLNTRTLYPNVVSATLGIFQVTLTTATAYSKEAEATGSATTGTGVTGATIPSFTATEFVVTADSGQQWKCYGDSIQNWGLSTPVAPFTATVPSTTRLWQPNLTIGTFSTLPASHYTIVTQNGVVQWAEGCTGTSGTALTTGLNYPAWGSGSGALGNNYYAPTVDGTIVWWSLGTIGTWQASKVSAGLAAPSLVILDSNQNLQGLISGAIAGTSGASPPTSWATTLGATTSDGSLTWTCLGPGIVLSTDAVEYSYSTHSISGNVSTAAPILTIPSGIIGAGTGSTGLTAWLTLLATGLTTDAQIDQYWIWRTTQGQTQLLFEDQIPADNLPTQFAYGELGIPDTSLDAEIEAPIDEVNDPPPISFTPSAYHLGRIWGFVDNTVYCSGGPDTVTGNGNEAFSPSNSFVFPSKVTRLWESTQGLFVFTVSDVYAILGSGTTASPFYSLPVITGVGLLNYNAFDVNGNTPYLFTSDGQMVSLSMGTGASEDGFPIGDQFLKVTTAGVNSALYNPNTAQVTWHIAGSPDKGLYVSDGAVGWFRLYPTPAPESGQTWAPFAAIVGGAGMVQSVEVVPGTHNLLIGPVTSGVILKRDRSVSTDNGTAYDAYFTLGSIVLAQPGQLAEVAFITTDSVKIGNAPNLSVQLDEIAPYSAGYFESLPATIVVPDPPQLSTSLSLYAQRYWLSNTQQPALCRHMQVRVDWGTDTVQNELLSLSLYGGFSQEEF